MKKGVTHLLAVCGLLFCMLLMGAGVEVYAADEIELPVPYNMQVTDGGYCASVTFDVPEYEYYYDLEYRVQCCKNGKWKNIEAEYESWGPYAYFYWLDGGEDYSFRARCELYYYNDEYQNEPIVGKWSEVVTMPVLFSAIELSSAEGISADSIKLTWPWYYNVDGYRIYRSTSKNGTYKLVKTINDPDRTSWTNTGRTMGKTYYYKIAAYYDGYTYPISQLSEPLSATPKLKRLALTAKSAGLYRIGLSWKQAEPCVDGYIIYRASKEEGEYKEIANISDGAVTSYEDKNLTFGKYYYYKIQSYCVANGELICSKPSAVQKARAMVIAPTLKSVKATAVTKAKLIWTKSPYATGYHVFRATSPNGEYKRVKKITSNKTTSCTVSNLVNGTRYYFKVRAYKEKNGKTYWGEFSEVKNVMMNKLGYEYESYESRTKRIWGTTYYKDYKSSSAASKNMTTIKIKTWDINSNGKKYTRTHYLTVHKNIASTVKQIFKEIYNGKEKFPIKSVGGYSWRGSSSSSEHCEGLAIDINPNENAQFNGSTGKAMVGSFYRPGKNAYSIPANGDVVNAFRKYGFGWGNWFPNPDYMHFSYFGT